MLEGMILLTDGESFQFRNHGVRNNPGSGRIGYQKLNVIAFVFRLQYFHFNIRAMKLFRHGLRPTEIITRFDSKQLDRTEIE